MESIKNPSVMELIRRSATSASPRSEAGASTPLHVAGKRTDILLGRDQPTFATRQGSFRHVNCSEDFCPSALPLFPQRQSFRHRIFGTVQPSRLDGLADKCFLIGG